ncbi:MAG: DUF4215 domain-containing protein [Bradymonadales bacterium]|nr:DUF4215 domain-containing protein [Bradymonadales bacterium]
MKPLWGTPLLLLLVLTQVGTPVSSQEEPEPTVIPEVTYDLNADWAQGYLLNLNYNTVDDQLQLNQTTTPFPFVNIALSGRGRIMRINVNTGQIVGEYWTAPQGMGLSPSRTTVDQAGNVWVGNRDENGVSPPDSGIQRGSVTRIGLVIGGTRVTGGGDEHEWGEYLLPPFDYNTCVDRDGDGRIRTSGRLWQVMDWSNEYGADSHGGVSTALDECILDYTRAGGGGTRALAIDANNNLWVGGGYSGLNLGFHEQVDGITGERTGAAFKRLCHPLDEKGVGGYGAVIDAEGILWSVSHHDTFLRHEDPPEGTWECRTDVPGNYGVGIDPITNRIWMTNNVDQFGNVDVRLIELERDGSLRNSYPLQPYINDGMQGVVVDENQHIWAAPRYGTWIYHYAPNPYYDPDDKYSVEHVFVGAVSECTEGVELVSDNPDFTSSSLNGATGFAVDSNGKIWAPEFHTNRASRIDPNLGPEVCFYANGASAVCGEGHVFSYHLGAIDMQVDLGGGAAPYNYSDMTGFVALGATTRMGWWTVVRDSGVEDANWGVISWNGSQPSDSSITVEARAANEQTELTSWTFVPVENGVPFDVNGQFIEVRVTLRGDRNESGVTISPILYDLTIASEYCGNGVVVDPEVCDDGALNGISCCTTSCTLASPGAACSDGLGQCSLDEFGSIYCQCTEDGYRLVDDYCQDIDECFEETDDCDPLVLCENTPGGYLCGDCPDGYTDLYDDGTYCEDIDECELDLHDCYSVELCQNTPGGWICLSCGDGYLDVYQDGTVCLDIDECLEGTHNCGDNATCINSTGSFTCTCNLGYTGDGVTCTDVDECTLLTDNCADNATCTNTVGSFDCTCNDGFAGNGVTCAEVDECDPNPCGEGTCQQIPIEEWTSPGYACTCNDGYLFEETTCLLDNECDAGLHNCAENAICTDPTSAVGDFTCACPPEHLGDALAEGTGCTDIDECDLRTDNCSDYATCTNIPSSFTCTCNDGYSGDGITCTDIDECDLGTDNCDDNATCTNTDGSFDCTCPDGYSGDGLTCTDIDECDLGTDNCDDNATCTNTDGSFDCTCPTGYTGDGLVCTDIDECALDTAGCDDNATCTNTSGGFTCSCNPGWSGDGLTCTTLCGDGLIVADELCDDENSTGGDGCSESCQVEANWVCSGTPSVCLPDMDGDGVADATDNCPSVYNPDQADSSGNGVGDACRVIVSGGGPGCSIGLLPGSAGHQLWWLAGLGVVVLVRRRQR